MVDIISRSAWGARTSESSAAYAEMNLGIATHWEGPTMGHYSREASWAKVKGIEAFHIDGRGWRDIAYNFIIDYYGQIFEGRGWNANNAANGGWGSTNYDYMSICYLGGIGDPLTDVAKEAYLELHEEYVRRGGANRAYSHNDILSMYGEGTQCSGPELINYTHQVLNEADFSTPIVVPEPTKEDMPDFIMGDGKNFVGTYSSGKVRILVWTEVVFWRDLKKVDYRDVSPQEMQYLVGLANRPF